MAIEIQNLSISPIRSDQSRFDYWADFLNKMACSKVAEVGVWKGEFAEIMLKSCASISSYFMIDPWRSLSDWNKPFNVDDCEFSEIYKEAMIRTDCFDFKRVVLREKTIEAGSKIKDHSLDFVYVDGDHTLRGITIDLNVMLSKVVRGGFIAGDDFTKTPWQHSSEFEPTLIFPYAVYFAEAHGLPIYALGQNQFLIHNQPSFQFSFTDLSNEYSDIDLLSLYDK